MSHFPSHSRIEDVHARAMMRRRGRRGRKARQAAASAAEAAQAWPAQAWPAHGKRRACIERAVRGPGAGAGGVRWRGSSQGLTYAQRTPCRGSNRDRPELPPDQKRYPATHVWISFPSS